MSQPVGLSLALDNDADQSSEGTVIDSARARNGICQMPRQSSEINTITSTKNFSQTEVRLQIER